MNKCTIISFSSRADGNCAKISKYLSNHYNRTNICLHIIDNNSFGPCNNCDYECLQPRKVCPNLTDAQTAIIDDICSSDLVYFIVPNYCGLPSANYFAFNERLVGYFNMDREKTTRYMNVRKRFIIVSNTEGFESAMQRQTTSKPEILYMKSGKYHKKSTAGDIMDSEDARAELDAFLAEDGF